MMKARNSVIRTALALFIAVPVMSQVWGSNSDLAMAAEPWPDYLPLLESEVESEEPKPLAAVPPEYAKKHMPDGWWTDAKILEEGAKLFREGFPTETGKDGKPKIEKCAKCHGLTGKPKARGAADMRVAKKFNRYSDAYLFWRVSEGVPKTKMKPWKEWLTEEQRWKVIAYLHGFSHGGKAEPHNHPELGK